MQLLSEAIAESSRCKLKKKKAQPEVQNYVLFGISLRTSWATTSLRTVSKRNRIYRGFWKHTHTHTHTNGNKKPR